MTVTVGFESAIEKCANLKSEEMPNGIMKIGNKALKKNSGKLKKKTAFDFDKYL